mmetsp:Transcript_31249/g.57280  ORF Transcript_31249/g.57280 Transcript_31249/m.57280 type:complete len:223 (+) Transcript_31249:110-778(+)
MHGRNAQKCHEAGSTKEMDLGQSRLYVTGHHGHGLDSTCIVPKSEEHKPIIAVPSIFVWASGWHAPVFAPRVLNNVGRGVEVESVDARDKHCMVGVVICRAGDSIHHATCIMHPCVVSDNSNGHRACIAIAVGNLGFRMQKLDATNWGYGFGHVAPATKVTFWVLAIHVRPIFINCRNATICLNPLISINRQSTTAATINSNIWSKETVRSFSGHAIKEILH